VGVPEGNESESDKAEDYLQLLEGDPHKQRHTFSSIDRTCSPGLDDAATKFTWRCGNAAGDFAAGSESRSVRLGFLAQGSPPSVWISGQESRPVRSGLLTLFGRFDAGSAVRRTYGPALALARPVPLDFSPSYNQPLLLLIIVLTLPSSPRRRVLKSREHWTVRDGLIAHPEWLSGPASA